MSLRQRLIDSISLDLPLSSQRAALSQFEDLSEEEIQELLQLYKLTHAGMLLEFLDPSKLDDYLPELLEFLQDGNWPAARGAAVLFVKAGEAAIPHIRKVFIEISDDAIWHSYIVRWILGEWESELVGELLPELRLLIERADEESAAIDALGILHRKKLLPDAEILALREYLKGKFSQNPALLQELEDEFRANP